MRPLRYKQLLRRPSLSLATAHPPHRGRFTSLSCDCGIAARPSVYRAQGSVPSLFPACPPVRVAMVTRAPGWATGRPRQKVPPCSLKWPTRARRCLKYLYERNSVCFRYPGRPLPIALQIYARLLQVQTNLQRKCKFFCDGPRNGPERVDPASENAGSGAYCSE